MNFVSTLAMSWANRKLLLSILKIVKTLMKAISVFYRSLISIRNQELLKHLFLISFWLFKMLFKIINSQIKFGKIYAKIFLEKCFLKMIKLSKYFMGRWAVLMGILVGSKEISKLNASMFLILKNSIDLFILTKLIYKNKKTISKII